MLVFPVIISLCWKLTCLLIKILNTISERWPIIRWLSHLGDSSGDLGLSIRERALLECGMA